MTKRKKPDSAPTTAPTTAPADAPTDDTPASKRHSTAPLPSVALSLPPPRRPLPPHQLVLAPMVGASELPFRLLCRRHGAQLCYTPMMHADAFCDAAHTPTRTGLGPLQTRPEDAPLVAHFCANDAETLLAAARRAEPYSVAIDLNLGCPQRSAHSGHYGAFLTDPCDRSLVLSMVSAVARGVGIPIFVKIRLQDQLEDTLAFCKQLEAAGAALIAVHGRVRGHWAHRRSGPADMEAIAAVKRTVSIPVLTNGNVRSAEDLLSTLACTGADGVMSAEGALDDPAIFARAAEIVEARRAKLLRKEAKAEALKAKAKAAGAAAAATDGGGSDALSAKQQRKVGRLGKLRAELKSLPAFDLPAATLEARRAWAPRLPPSSPFALADQYFALAKTYTVPMTCLTFHLRRILKPQLTAHGMIEALVGSRNLVEVRTHLDECRRLCREAGDEVAEDSLPPSQIAAAAAAAAAGGGGGGAPTDGAATALTPSQKKRNHFVERMKRKAQREGKPEGHYLTEGLVPPSADDIKHAIGLDGAGGHRSERHSWWRARFGQHCIAHYVDLHCAAHASEEGCGFLHGDDCCLDAT